MFQSVRKRRSLTSILDKMYPQFHQFSVGMGYELCCTVEKGAKFTVPEMLWQLLLEREFQDLVKSEPLQVAESRESNQDQAWVKH